MLTVKDLHKSYQVGKTTYEVLKGVSLTVEKGEFVAVMGPSGSGKTTLLNCISCYIPIDSGEIMLGDRQLANLSEDALAKVRNRQLGFVFQDFLLLDGLTVRENILPLREDGGKLLAEVFRQRVDLLRQLSGQTTGTAIGPRHLVPHFADEGPEAAQRGQGRVREATLQLLRDGEPVAVYEFRAEPFLCLEIVVERTPRNTRALQYLVDPHCGIAFFRQHFRPDVDQHFPGQQFVAALLGRAATAFGVLRVILHG